MLETKKLIILDKYINKVTEEKIIPAINLSILTNSGNWMCSHGNKQVLPMSSPNSLDTLYDISSLTMPFITLPLILKLDENNELKLSDKINKYIKEYKNDTTIIECLSHTSGIPDELAHLSNFKKEEVLKKIYNIKILKKNIGKFHKSWINYFLLGLIIKQIKTNISDYAIETLYEPLNMKRTYFDPDLMLKSNCACTTIVNGVANCGSSIDKYTLLFDGKTGHSGCFVTLQDISHYVTTLLNKGKFRKTVFFTEDQLNLIFDEYKNTNHTLSYVKGKAQSPIPELVSEDAIFYLSETGCAILIEPKKGYGIVFLSNPFHLNKDQENFNEVFKEPISLAIDSINI